MVDLTAMHTHMPCLYLRPGRSSEGPGLLPGGDRHASGRARDSKCCCRRWREGGCLMENGVQSYHSAAYGQPSLSGQAPFSRWRGPALPSHRTCQAQSELSRKLEELQRANVQSSAKERWAGSEDGGGGCSQTAGECLTQIQGYHHASL